MTESIRIFFNRVVAAAVVATLFVSCAQRQSDAQVDNSRKGGSATYRYLLFEATRHENAGNYAAAFDLYREALKVDPDGHEAYFSIAPYYYDLDEDSLGLEYTKRAALLNPKNADYQERLGQSYVMARDFDNAIKAYEALLANNSQREEALEVLRQLYLEKGDYAGALATIERAELADGTSDETTFAKLQVYQMQNDTLAARRALEQLMEEHPNDVNYKVMYGNWLQQNGQNQEALAAFLAAERDDPMNEAATESLYDYYRLNNQDSLAGVYRDRILYNRYASFSTRMLVLSRIEEETADSTQMMAVFDRMHEADPQSVQVLLAKLQYMANKDFPLAEQEPVMQLALELDPELSYVRQQLLRIKWMETDLPAVVALCSEGADYDPDELIYYYFLGLAQYQLDNEEEALDAFQRGANHVIDDSSPAVASDLYSFLGDILHTFGRLEEAYQAYDRSLSFRPHNVACLNNYAYYLSEENRDLDRAAEMSRITVEKEPENATYLDTYAWILFLQERYAEAHSYIMRAVECLDEDYNNSTIYEHAGDISLTIGEKKEAVRFWRLSLDEGSENEAGLLKKIKENEK